VPLGRSRPFRPGRGSWLPWIVLALVPLFFLAGFGIVSALAGGDDPETQRVTAAPSTRATATGTAEDAEEAPPPATTDIDASAPVDTEAPTTTTTTTTTTTPPAETGEDGPPANPGAIEIDYGRWQGMFEVADARIVPSLQTSTAGGEFTYLGGVRCPIRNVVVEGRFYDRERVSVGLALWESTWVTGESGLEERRPVPFGAYGSVLHRATSGELQVVRVVCA
jgi:hypothetical protein